MMDRSPLRRIALRTTGRRASWLRRLGGADLPRRLAGVAILSGLTVFGLSRLAPDGRTPDGRTPSSQVPSQVRALPVPVPAAPSSVPSPVQPTAPPVPAPPPGAIRAPDVPPAASAGTRQEALDRILLTDFDWRKDVFGAVASATFSIRNTAGRDARDIVVACVYFMPGGAVAGTRLRRTYEQVRAGETIVVRDLSMGLIPEGAQRVACEVQDAVLE